MITVEQIMTPREELVTMTPGDTITSAAETMASRRIRHIPVIAADGALVGIVSDRDVLAATGQGTGKSLSEIMSTALHMTEAAASVHRAALLLRRLGVSCLPVMASGELVGIVTDTDYVGVAINLLEVIEDSEP